MSLLAQQSNARPMLPNEGGKRSRSPAALLAGLYREWGVRRQMAQAQMLDGASLRDIGVAPGGLENAIRHGREARR